MDKQKSITLDDVISCRSGSKESGRSPASAEEYAPHYAKYARDVQSRDNLRVGSTKKGFFCCGKHGVIEPEKSKFLPRWDAICGLGLIFICFAAPVEVAFMDGTISWPLFVANRFVDFIFIVDLVLQFFIAYPLRVRHTIMFVLHKRIIARHYLTTWFVIDFISIVPFDLVAMLADSKEANKLHLLKVVRLFRLLKLLRLLKGVRIFERWQMEWGISHRKMTLWGLVVGVIIASHWMSCMLGLVSQFQGVPCTDGPGLPKGCVETWYTNALEITSDGSYGRTTPGEAYLIALHTAITVIVHPHAFYPTGPGENLVFIVVLLLGGFVWTRVISRSTAISTSLDRHKIQFKQTMDDVNSISDDLGLSVALRRQLRGFFIHTQDYSKQETWTELTRHMSPQLRRATAREVNWPWVQQIPYLKGCSWPMITAVAEGLETQRYAQHEIFGKPCHLYVLSRGLVSRTVSLTKLLHPGAVWGEDHLLLYCSYLFEDVTCVAQCYSEVLAMTRARFEEIAEDNPENAKVLRKYYVKISVARGVRYLANQCRKRLTEQKRKAEGGTSEQVSASNRLSKQYTLQGEPLESLIKEVCDDALPTSESLVRNSVGPEKAGPQKTEEKEASQTLSKKRPPPLQAPRVQGKSTSADPQELRKCLSDETVNPNKTEAPAFGRMLSLGTPLTPGAKLRSSEKSVEKAANSLQISLAIQTLQSDMEELGAEFDGELKAMRSTVNEKLSSLVAKANQLKGVMTSGTQLHGEEPQEISSEINPFELPGQVFAPDSPAVKRKGTLH